MKERLFNTKQTCNTYSDNAPFKKKASLLVLLYNKAPCDTSQGNMDKIFMNHKLVTTEQILH